ncbi:MAG: bacillithiol system redox-active protein YtxJ [Cytophagales bacterium]|nr:bacillithiol system redox-active protein YtxJ [Cytophaga sp.]
MNWIALTEETQLQEIIQESSTAPVMIFKHSTRCSISSTSLSRMERNWKEEEMNGIKSYYLDLIQYSPISAKIASIFSVEHESPQVLLIKNGKSVWDASHYDIQYDALKKEATL